ncbi:MAG: xyloglucanase [Polyangiaceae bacterium]|nr:xyloglucanase [Polyangiaceae bacterium]
MKTKSPVARTQLLATLVALTGAACLTPPHRGGQSAAEAAAAGRGTSGSGALSAVAYRYQSVVLLGGGFVTGVIFSPAKAGILYARTDIGGAYRFDTDTQSWIPLTDFIGKADRNNLGIESIAPDPVEPNRVYMAVGMYSQSWAPSGAFMRSDNRGDTWETIPIANLKMGGNEDGRSNGERLAVDPHQTQILYFGSRRSGLWKSTDSASSWSKVESFPVKEDPSGLGIPFVVFDPKSGASGQPTPTLYAGASNTQVGLYRTVDAGRSWTPVPKQPTGMMPSHAEFDTNGVLYLSYGSGPGPSNVTDGAIYRYEPKTGTWTDITPIQPTRVNEQFGYGAVAVDRLRPGTLLASTMDRWSAGEVFRSTDAGKTWKPLMARAELDAGGAPWVYGHQEQIPAPQWVGDISIDPFASGHAALVTGGGVWASEDVTAADRDQPTHWVFSNKNLEETVVLDMVSPPSGPLLLTAIGDICGFRHDRLDQSPSRGSFDHPHCANSTAIDFAQAKPNVVVRVGSYPWDGSKPPRGAISTDAGATWTQFRSEPQQSGGSGTVALSADASTIVWAPRSTRAAYSKDQGATWTRVAGLPNAGQIPDWAPLNLRLAADRVNARKFYAYDALAGLAYASSTGGTEFVRTVTDLPTLPDYQLSGASIQAVPGFEGDVWVTTGKEPLHSTDSGQSYSPLDGVEEADAIGFGRAAPGQKYPALYLSGKVKGTSGFFRSDDAGGTFVRINDDAHQYGGSNQILGDPRVYGRVYVAGSGRGILYGEPE